LAIGKKDKPYQKLVIGNLPKLVSPDCQNYDQVRFLGFLVFGVLDFWHGVVKIVNPELVIFWTFWEFDKLVNFWSIFGQFLAIPDWSFFGLFGVSINCQKSCFLVNFLG
jgi:hypothetical protein